MGSGSYNENKSSQTHGATSS
ncbi:hypothetical protein ACLB1M_20660 [Escherichia coli]